MSETERRLVTVTAVVMTEKTEDQGGIAESYAAVAAALAELAAVRRRVTGPTRSLHPMKHPLVRLEARSEPVTREEAAALSVTDLREMLDDATRVAVNLGRAAEVAHAREIRERAGLEAL